MEKCDIKIHVFFSRIELRVLDIFFNILADKYKTKRLH